MLAATPPVPPAELHNIYEGKLDSWQLHESIDNFLERLPPATTSVALCPWIWVANPHRGGQGKSSRILVDEFTERGVELLQQSQQKRGDIQAQNSNKPKGVVAKMLSRESELLKQQITDIAKEKNVIAGKWMLFPRIEDLTRVWRLIAEGTVENRLGSTAKVATDQGGSDSRLICVYTKDFSDTEDVRRVLQELDAMGLVGSGQGIYYKSDAYTYLDIYGKNAAEYGLQASIYSSQKMLASVNSSQSKSTPQRKQSTLDAFCRV
ncbi:DUF1917-domain-containing protein [Zopfia rhizophila CBS 207.26]|uniref:DUF1917-domain-containing protein n=1 Tax=Zopfia rhizophila CBS 207.26 TaxID=1314779 RepID=A0A6A6EXJ0_9PEZI|nr:DUF1917-domain-containing protein [Zopfia rhizophila CBS 207.26]